jgi:O-methyltransferase
VKHYPPGYGRVEPVADYRPWDTDEPFLAAYEQIRDYTKVDIYRCYTLWTLVRQALDLPGDVMEVGVWRGGTAALLGMQLARAAPQRRLYLADTFAGVVKAGPRDDYYKGGEHADADRETVEALLARCEIPNATVLAGVFPEETGAAVEGRAISFCHVDVDVYQSAKDVVEWVWPRLPVGGVVVYDDWGFYGCEGVTALGHEDMEKQDRLFIPNLSGQGILVKRS